MLNRLKLVFILSISFSFAVFLSLFSIWYIISGIVKVSTFGMEFLFVPLFFFIVISFLTASIQFHNSLRAYLLMVLVGITWVVIVILMIFSRKNFVICSLVILPVFAFLYCLLCIYTLRKTIVINTGGKKTKIMPRGIVNNENFFIYWFVWAFYGFLMFDLYVVTQALTQTKISAFDDIMVVVSIILALIDILAIYITFKLTDRLSRAVNTLLYHVDNKKAIAMFQEIEESDLEAETVNYIRAIKINYMFDLDTKEALRLIPSIHVPLAPEFKSVYYMVKSRYYLNLANYEECKKNLLFISRMNRISTFEKKRMIAIIKLLTKEKIIKKDIKILFKTKMQKYYKIRNSPYLALFYSREKKYDKAEKYFSYFLKEGDALPSSKQTILSVLKKSGEIHF